ncbi:hypothetical protein BC332_34453 [Capsicum chinense]|nr:hypothetical protein BC332_34453 [Capsicum chinense]
MFFRTIQECQDVFALNDSGEVSISISYDVRTSRRDLLKTVHFFHASGYSTARIWTIGDGPCNSHMQNGPVNVMVLKNFKGRTNKKNKDVSTILEWNGEGNLLATGSYDGQTIGSYDHFRLKLIIVW